MTANLALGSKPGTAPKPGPILSDGGSLYEELVETILEALVGLACLAYAKWKRSRWRAAASAAEASADLELELRHFLDNEPTTTLGLIPVPGEDGLSSSPIPTLEGKQPRDSLGPIGGESSCIMSTSNF